MPTRQAIDTRNEMSSLLSKITEMKCPVNVSEIATDLYWIRPTTHLRGYRGNSRRWTFGV